MKMTKCPCCFMLALRRRTDPNMGHYVKCISCDFFSTIRTIKSPASKNDENKIIITDNYEIGKIIRFSNDLNAALVEIDGVLEQINIDSLHIIEEA